MCVQNISPVICVIVRDRCDVITFAKNTKEQIFSVLEKHTLPNEQKKYGDIVIVEHILIEELVDTLYKKGITSLRPYQKAISKLINKGIISSKGCSKPYYVTKEQLDDVLRQYDSGHCGRSIGFV